MKRLLAFFLLIACLAACASAPTGKGGCSEGGEVCIQVRAEEPISFGGQVNITITINSQVDLPNLGIYLTTWPQSILVLDPTSKEEATVTRKEASWVNWIIEAKAGQHYLLTRRIQLPPDQGVFSIDVKAYLPNLLAQDYITINMTHEGGKVFLPGSFRPTTNNPSGPLPTTDPIIVETILARPTETSWPTLTSIPATSTQPRELLHPNAYPPPPQTPYP